MRMVRTCGPFSCACWRLPQSGCHLIFHVQPWPLICGVWISSVHPKWQHDVCFSQSGLCPPKVCVGYPEDAAGRVSLWWRIPIKRNGLSMSAGWISTDGVLLFNGWQPYVVSYGMCRLLVHDLVCASPKKIQDVVSLYPIFHTCSTKKSDVHHSVPETVSSSNQHQLSFRVFRCSSFACVHTTTSKNLMVFINKPSTHATPKIWVSP